MNLYHQKDIILAVNFQQKLNLVFESSVCRNTSIMPESFVDLLYLNYRVRLSGDRDFNQDPY
jgi:hypothetical protein